jgi:hypothetical protein
LVESAMYMIKNHVKNKYISIRETFYYSNMDGEKTPHSIGTTLVPEEERTVSGEITARIIGKQLKGNPVQHSA